MIKTYKYKSGSLGATQNHFQCKRGMMCIIFLTCSVLFLSGFTNTSMANESSVELGSAASFGVLAVDTVTNVNSVGTTVTGDVGVYPGTAVTNFPPGVLAGGGAIHAGDPTAQEAQSDLKTAIQDAAGRTNSPTGPVTISGNLGGMTLTPGLYKSTSSLEISSGDLTLDAQGDPNAVFIFQMASTFTVTSGRQIILAGDASPYNIFWSVGSSATFGTTSVIKGTVLASVSITLETGASLVGRALAKAAVSLDANEITVPKAPPTSTPTPVSSTSTPTPVLSTSTPTPVSATNTPTPVSSTSTPTPVSTSTPTHVSSTSTPTPVSTSTPTPVSATNTPTPVSSTSTPTPVSTSTPTPVSATNTPTPVSSTSTPTPVSATNTNTPTVQPTSTITQTPTVTPKPTATITPESSSNNGVINLGLAGDFAALAGSTITNVASVGTSVAGTIGVSPGSEITGFPPGIVTGSIHAGNDLASLAQADLTTAFNNAAERSSLVTISGNIGGETLSPGVYKSTSSLEISSGDLTLDAMGNPDAVFLFQIATTLTATNGRQVILNNGAKASNIFWQVGSSAILETASVFKGIIMAAESITLKTGASLEGRALALNGAINLDSNNITTPLIDATPTPTNIAVPPTSTPVLPTSTPIPPTNTPVLPTTTPAPPPVKPTSVNAELLNGKVLVSWISEPNFRFRIDAVNGREYRTQNIVEGTTTSTVFPFNRLFRNNDNEDGQFRFFVRGENESGGFSGWVPSRVLTINLPGPPIQLFATDNAASNSVIGGNRVDHDAYNKREIALKWELDESQFGSELTDIHVQLFNEDTQTFTFLGNTNNGTSRSLIWRAGNPNIAKAFRSGPSFGTYQFQIVPRNNKQNLGFFASEPVRLEPAVTVADSIADTEDISTGMDTDASGEEELVIRWQFDEADVDISTAFDYHVYASVDGGPMQYVGRPGNGTATKFVWRANEGLLSNAFRNGPQDQTSYNFAVYVIHKKIDAQNEFTAFGPNFARGPVTFNP